MQSVSKESASAVVMAARQGSRMGALFVLTSVFAWSVGALAADGPVAVESPETVYTQYVQHCASCHGMDRLGGMGPALLPENLSRLRKPAAIKSIQDGLVATQMPAFGDTLAPEMIAAIADFIYSPVVPSPRWLESDILASRIQHVDPATLSDTPIFDADPWNVFLVVEGGDHHVSVLDGDRMEPIHRFQSRYALHGGPKFAQEGRYVYFGSRDGWVTKFDLWNLTVVSEVRAGINTRNVAVSPDGNYVAVANYLPHTLVLLDGDLNLLKVLDVTSTDGTQSSRVSAVYEASPRKSFVAALKDVAEVWEISYDPQAEDIPVGVIHDHRMREGNFVPGYLNPRRTVLADVLDDFFFTQDYSLLMGASRSGVGQVVSLDARRRIADLGLDGMPHLGSGITFDWQGRRVMASTNLIAAEVTVIDMDSFEVVKRIPTRGPGFFLRSHENSRYAFVDSMMSPEAKHILQVIDKETLEIAHEIFGPPGETLAHIEFDREGKYALASLWEFDGAIIVFDAETLEEVKRLPMKKPVGKYNVWNKVMREEGTSH